MKKIMKIGTIILLISIILLLGTKEVAAIEKDKLLNKMEYSEDFKRWLQLSDDEKKRIVMPRMYEIENTKTLNTNPLYRARMLKANINSKYSLKDIIPSNLVIRNQKNTNSCWAFAELSSLETNLALTNYKKGINASKVYDFSERHMEYATSKKFANNVENEKGYNRVVGEGGSYRFAESYLANGIGAVLETDMPFENNEDIVDINKIQNKTIASQVYDTVYFPNYRYETDETKLQIINQIKQHIQNYGSVNAVIHASSSDFSDCSCYNNDTGAKFCDNSIMHGADHAISIIGWDDNYSINNFSQKCRPKSNGAWIVRNSWGERVEYKLLELKEMIFNTYKQQCISRGWSSPEKIPNSFIEENGYTIEGDIAYIKNGDNGIIYVSYEDVNISKEMVGIVKAADIVDYDNIYQYDEFYPSMQIRLSKPNMMLCNVFNKKTNGIEYLTQVSLYVPKTYTCKVYVNPNGISKAKNDLQLVALKSGDSEKLEAGYHTLEFSKPIEIKGESFAVAVEINSDNNGSIIIPLESKVDKVKEWDSVTVENGKCFLLVGNNLENSEWMDLSRLTEVNPSLVNGDSTIKAFTKTELTDDSLKNIEIITPPVKTTYLEGENFDKTGMVVKANYVRKTNPTVILDSSSYDITNGTNLKVGQTDVTITYKDKSVNQKITVEKNNLIDLKIKTPPIKTEYKEGESFEKAGLEVEAIYQDGTKKVVSDYKIEDGSNLKANQRFVTISYENKKVQQPITVTQNQLIKIEVTKAPNKIKYVKGQNFDKTGMVVTGKYQDNTTQEIIDYTIENGNNLTKEQTFVIINYADKTTTQSIIVEEKAITGITINRKPAKTQYIQNKEKLDLTGGLINVNYNDGSSEKIELTSELVKVTGFDNSKIGKNTILVTYQSKTTSFDIEIVTEKIAKSSNFKNAKGKINNTKYYTFTNKDKQEYFLMDITVNSISRILENDNCEYYYYLSSNQVENNIENWVKITEKQTANDRLQFKINTKDIKNYSELSDVGTLYLYIKEVATKGGDQKIALSRSISLESTGRTEIYVDNVKKDSSIVENVDSTVVNKILPKAGTKNIIITFAIILFIVIAILCYFKWNNIKEIR